LTADKREFLRISQAVGMGFLIMGVIGYIVKLSKCLPPTKINTVQFHECRETDFNLPVHIPVNNILVGGA
jgi:protein transport protein SEC61 subunit gamma-like protein